jgi:hypothetical protein
LWHHGDSWAGIIAVHLKRFSSAETPTTHQNETPRHYIGANFLAKRTVFRQSGFFARILNKKPAQKYGTHIAL